MIRYAKMIYDCKNESEMQCRSSPSRGDGKRKWVMVWFIWFSGVRKLKLMIMLIIDICKYYLPCVMT